MEGFGLASYLCAVRDLLPRLVGFAAEAEAEAAAAARAAAAQ
jgi:hypothetical protein